MQLLSPLGFLRPWKGQICCPGHSDCAGSFPARKGGVCFGLKTSEQVFSLPWPVFYLPASLLMEKVPWRAAQLQNHFPKPNASLRNQRVLPVPSALRVISACPHGQEKGTKHPSKAMWCGMERPGCPKSPAAALVCSGKEQKTQTSRKERRAPVKYSQLSVPAGISGPELLEN